MWNVGVPVESPELPVAVPVGAPLGAVPHMLDDKRRACCPGAFIVCGVAEPVRHARCLVLDGVSIHYNAVKYVVVVRRHGLKPRIAANNKC